MSAYMNHFLHQAEIMVLTLINKLQQSMFTNLYRAGKWFHRMHSRQHLEQGLDKLDYASLFKDIHKTFQATLPIQIGIILSLLDEDL